MYLANNQGTYTNYNHCIVIESLGNNYLLYSGKYIDYLFYFLMEKCPISAFDLDLTCTMHVYQ